MDSNARMQCGNCGKTLEDGDKYCRRCGTKAGEGTFKPKKNLSMQILYGPMPVKQVHRCTNCGRIWTMFGKEHCPECGKMASGLNWNSTNPAYCSFMEVVKAGDEVKKALDAFQSAIKAFNLAAEVMKSQLEYPESDEFEVHCLNGKSWDMGISALSEKMRKLIDNYIGNYSRMEDSKDTTHPI